MRALKNQVMLLAQNPKDPVWTCLHFLSDCSSFLGLVGQEWDKMSKPWLSDSIGEEASQFSWLWCGLQQT